MKYNKHYNTIAKLIAQAWQEKQSDYEQSFDKILDCVRSEVGYMEKREGLIAMCDHWLRGLALNIPFNNYDIAVTLLGKDMAEQLDDDALYDLVEHYWLASANILALSDKNIYLHALNNGTFVDNHQSDLYIRMTESNHHFMLSTDIEYSATTFIDEITGKACFDVMGCYTPFWWNKSEHQFKA